jgi:hypothetical protein
MSNQDSMKKFAIRAGDSHGSGCHYEVNSFSVQPDPVKFSTKRTFLRAEPETVSQPTHHEGAFLSVSSKNITSGDERFRDNRGDTNLQDSLKPTECLQRAVIPKPINIDSCESWRLDVEQSNVLRELCDQRPERTLQDFHVPPLELGSFVDDDGLDSNKNCANSTYSSSVIEAESMSESHLHCSTEVNLSSSYQDISESIRHSSRTYVDSDFQAHKALNEVKFASNNVYPHLSNAWNTDSQQHLETYGSNSRSKKERRQYDNVQPLKDDAVERRMSDTSIQSDSLKDSGATTTSYRSIEPHKMIREIKCASTYQYSGQKRDHHVETNDCGISATGTVPVCIGHESWDHHAAERLVSPLELPNTTEYLGNSCACPECSGEFVVPSYHRNDTSIESENFAGEKDSRNISHRGTEVNFPSVLSSTECGAKRTVFTDRVLSSVTEAASSKDLIFGRYVFMYIY